MLEKKHEMIRKLARNFAVNEIAPLANDIDKTGEHPEELRNKIIRYKFHCITIPKEYGGAGGDCRSACIVTEEFSRFCPSTSTILMPNSLSSAPILYFGNEQQKRKYLSALVDGSKVGAFGLTEPDAGSDVSAIMATAELDGNEYVLNGRKTFITNGPICDFITILAKTDTSARGVRGMSAFIVEADMAGFSRGKTEEKLGIHGSPTSDIILENVRVPKENLLGKEGQGYAVCLATLDSGRVTVAAQGLGIAQGALDEAIRYTQERIQFGKTIASFQNTQFEIADMATKVQCGRLLVYDSAYRQDMGENITTQASMAKYYCGELCNDVAYRSLQLHGGYGFMREYPIERLFRDARIMSIYEGTSEIQKVIIAGKLLGKS